MGPRAAGLVVVFVVPTPGNGTAEPERHPNAPRVRIVGRLEAAAGRSAVAGATRRLRREGCRRILTAFSTLGPGENPPVSTVIRERVAARGGR
jgi:hypothetical protein